jgi:transcription elongation factor Elf1
MVKGKKIKSSNDIQVNAVDHYKLFQCTRCGSETETIYTVLGFVGKKVESKIELCQACYKAPNVQGAFLDNA